MSWGGLQEIFKRFKALGASRTYLKLLAHNDNKKQQIYLGGSFEVIRLLPFYDLHPEEGVKQVTFKARLDFHWLDDAGITEAAPGTQLILYPNYPEVRMSGFVRGCSRAPSERLEPLTPEQREELDRIPRALLLGVCEDGRVLGYTTEWGDNLAQEAQALVENHTLPVAASIFHEWNQPAEEGNQLEALLARLREVHNTGWTESFRLDGDGIQHEYKAPNGAGYTLEALLGITPNGTPEPDLLGWELKAHTGNGRVTLMTPEPTVGAYADGYIRFMQATGALLLAGDSISPVFIIADGRPTQRG